MVIWLTIVLLALSHGWYLVPLGRAVRRSEMPAPIDLVGLSAVAYFDLGVLLEGCGLKFHSSFFAPFFEASQAILIPAIFLIAAAPWLMRIGAAAIPIAPSGRVACTLKRGSAKIAFYVLLICVCVACVLLPLSLIALTPRLWETRALLGEKLGPGIIVLSLPMYLLAFYVPLRDARTRLGKCVLAFLLVSSTLAALAGGERTLVLLPWLLVVLFAQGFSWKRCSAALALGTLATTLMVPLFKSAYQESSESVLQRLADTVNDDLYRAPELAATLRISSSGGGVSYPGKGYIYAAFYFLPRVVAPFKGESSAQQFTARIMQQAPGSLSWGFGISAISEAILNFGVLLAPIVLLAYGATIGYLTARAAHRPSLEVPLCLAALWMFGYHLSALLLNFGAMAVIGLISERIFTIPVSDLQNAESERLGTSR